MMFEHILIRYKLIYFLMLSLFMTGCNADKFYVPINNQTGSAPSLSQKDIIRVVMPAEFQQQKNTQVQNNLFINAKVITDHYLQSLGYTVIDGGYNPHLINHAVNWEDVFQYRYNKNLIDFQLKQLGYDPDSNQVKSIMFQSEKDTNTFKKAKDYLLNQHQQLSNRLEKLRADPKILANFDYPTGDFHDSAYNKIIVDQYLEAFNTFPQPTVIAVINATQETVPQPSKNIKEIPKTYQIHQSNLNKDFYKISYTIRLFRPSEPNSPLLNCNNTSESMGYCLSISLTNHTPLIFTGHGSIITNSYDIHADLGFIIYSILHSYPIVGNKEAYFKNVQSAQYNLTHFEN